MNAANNSSSRTHVDDDATRLRKREMRTHIRSQLSLLTDEQIVSESRLVWKRVMELPQYRNAESIAVFLSMPQGEIRTDDIIADAVQRGKRIYVPHIRSLAHEEPRMEMVEVPRDQVASSSGPLFFASWPRDRWQIPVPPAPETMKVATLPTDIELYIVPGLAFDRKGNRLGQGKGYYDRYFQRMLGHNDGNAATDDDATNVRDSPRPFLAAVGLRCQLVEGDEQVPVSSTDQPVDVIATPDELLVFRNSAASGTK
jgi:5-formyltetrahydrofolate cyclo-ligase